MTRDSLLNLLETPGSQYRGRRCTQERHSHPEQRKQGFCLVDGRPTDSQARAVTSSGVEMRW